MWARFYDGHKIGFAFKSMSHRRWSEKWKSKHKIVNFIRIFDDVSD